MLCVPSSFRGLVAWFASLIAFAFALRFLRLEPVLGTGHAEHFCTVSFVPASGLSFSKLLCAQFTEESTKLTRPCCQCKQKRKVKFSKQSTHVRSLSTDISENPRQDPIQTHVTYGAQTKYTSQGFYFLFSQPLKPSWKRSSRR